MNAVRHIDVQRKVELILYNAVKNGPLSFG